MVFKNVLERSLRTVFGQHAWHTLNDGPAKSHEVIVLDIFHSLQFHHQRPGEINWRQDFLHGDSVAFVAADGDEDLAIVHHVSRIHRLRTRFLNGGCQSSANASFHYQLWSRSGVNAAAHLVRNRNRDNFVPVDLPRHRADLSLESVVPVADERNYCHDHHHNRKNDGQDREQPRVAFFGAERVVETTEGSIGRRCRAVTRPVDRLSIDECQTSAVEIICDILELVGLRIHVQQRVVRKSVSVVVDGHVPGDSLECRAPHQLGQSGAIQRLHQRLFSEFCDAWVQRLGEQQNGIVESRHELTDLLVLVERVVVLLLRQNFDLRSD